MVDAGRADLGNLAMGRAGTLRKLVDCWFAFQSRNDPVDTGVEAAVREAKLAVEEEDFYEPLLAKFLEQDSQGQNALGSCLTIPSLDSRTQANLHQ